MLDKGRPEDEIRATTSVILDGDISASRLKMLIGLQREENELDFKERYDLSDRQSYVEFVCDAVAMANTEGGYLVIGVAEEKKEVNKFVPVGLSEDQVSSLDVTKLLNKIKSYIDTDFQLKLQIHQLSEFDNKRLALVFVPQSTYLPIVFSKMGQYPNKKSEQHPIMRFRQGDVFVRRDVASVEGGIKTTCGVLSLICVARKRTYGPMKSLESSS